MIAIVLRTVKHHPSSIIFISLSLRQLRVSPLSPHLVLPSCASLGMEKMALVGLSIGVPFGVLLHKGRVFDPNVIADQLRMTDMTMLKVRVCGCV